MRVQRVFDIQYTLGPKIDQDRQYWDIRFGKREFLMNTILKTEFLK